MAADAVMPAVQFERWGTADAPPPAVSMGASGASGMPQAVAFERWGDAAAKPSVAEDVAKSGGIGVVKGGIGLAGLPGDLTQLAGSGVDWAAKKLMSPEQFAVYSAPENQGPQLLPTSGDIQHKVEGATGEFYQPQTRAGRFAQTIGEFAPAAIGGPESLGAKLMRMTVPAVASEAAGQATEGTALEPVARIAGALAGGGTAATLGRSTKLAPPTIAELKDASRAGYRSPEVDAVEIHPQAVSGLAAKIENDLATNGFRPTSKSSSDTFREVRGLQVPSNVASVKVADIDNARRALGNLAREVDAVGKPTTEAAAAARAIEHIDDFLPNLKQGDLIAGDAGKANAILNEARGNWGAAKRAEKVADAVDRADLNAAVANSGQNIDNATRQRIKAILINPKLRAGFSPAEQIQLHQIARGTSVGNLSRAVGNVLGGGGGLGALASGVTGVVAAGPVGMLAPVAGYAAKKIGNASTARGVQRLDEAVRARSPLNQASVAARSPSVSQLTPMQQRLRAAALGIMAAPVGRDSGDSQFRN